MQANLVLQEHMPRTVQISTALRATQGLSTTNQAGGGITVWGLLHCNTVQTGAPAI